MSKLSMYEMQRRKFLACLTSVVALAGCGGEGGDGGSSSGDGSGGGGGAGGGNNQLPRLRIQGSEILDPSGKAIMLRGWNWGRWGFTQPNDAQDNLAEGANCVRIPLRWWGKYDGVDIDSRDDAQVNTAGIDAAHLAILDAMVVQAVAAKLWIILFIDSDCGQNGAQDANEIAYCDPQGVFPNGHNFWSDLNERAKFINVWKFIAARYKDTPYIGMFEPLPEPNPNQVVDSQIVSFYHEVMTAIRSVAPNIPFLVGARLYNMNLSGSAYSALWNDVIYTGNLFLYTGGTQQQNIDNLSQRLQHLLDLRTTKNVPIFVQQVGVKSADDDEKLTYLNAQLSLLNQSQVGYTYWEYRDNLNPNGYGVFFRDANGVWQKKDTFLNTVSLYFRS